MAARFCVTVLRDGVVGGGRLRLVAEFLGHSHVFEIETLLGTGA